MKKLLIILLGLLLAASLFARGIKEGVAVEGPEFIICNGAEPETLDAPTPPPSVRVNTDTLDRFLSTVGEVILNSNQLRTSADASANSKTAGLAGGLDRMDRVVGELQRRALELRTTPLLRIDRRAYALDDQPIEWRVSLCHLKGMHYLATIK